MENERGVPGKIDYTPLLRAVTAQDIATSHFLSVRETEILNAFDSRVTELESKQKGNEMAFLEEIYEQVFDEIKGSREVVVKVLSIADKLDYLDE